jgi:3',5'-cyclic AMP phosphodiesterase CpdA
MRTIAHISNLHFGRLKYRTLPGLREALFAVNPDMLVVSGDLTEQAKAQQFKEARQFLDTLPQPQLVVPGWHDVPRYNFLRRWLRPFGKYRRHVSRPVKPFHRDSEIAVLGLPATPEGDVDQRRLQKTCAPLACSTEPAARILVTPQPFDAAYAADEDDILGRGSSALASFAACGVDMILTGRLYENHALESADRETTGRNSALMIAAGTATSTRRRREGNAWNFIRIDWPEIWIDRMSWRGGGFDVVRTDHFRRGEEGWRALV